MVAEPLKGVNPLFHQVYWLPIVWGNLQPLPQYSCCSSSLYQTQKILKQSYIILWVDWTAFSLSRIWHCGDPFLSRRGRPEPIIWPGCNSWLLVELQSGHTILVQQTLRKRQCIRKQSSLRDCLTRHLKHPTQKSLRIIRLKMHPCSLPSDWLNLVATHHLETINVYIVVLVFVFLFHYNFACWSVDAIQKANESIIEIWWMATQNVYVMSIV